VCKALGLSHNGLNAWARQGILKNWPAEKTVPGKARRFTVEDVTFLAIFKTITDFGVPLALSKSWADECCTFWNSLAPQMTEYTQLIRNGYIWVRRLNDDIMLEAAPPGAHIRFTIFVKQIIDDTKRKLGFGEPQEVETAASSGSAAGASAASAQGLAVLHNEMASAPRRAPRRGRRPRAAAG
jgi:hypothetical protein